MDDKKLEDFIKAVLEAREKVGDTGEQITLSVEKDDEDPLEGFNVQKFMPITDDITKADAVACMPDGPSDFDDNVTGLCVSCGCKVMFRPHIPESLPKICIDCVIGDFDEQQQQ